MKKILDSVTWGFLIIFFVPCILIVASWEALPGDPLFGVKLSMERAAVAAFFPSYSAQGNLEIAYTERRFNESQKLLSANKSTKESEIYLRQQIITTRDIVLKAPDRTTRRELARTATVKLNKIKQEIIRTQNENPTAYLASINTTQVSNNTNTQTTSNSNTNISTPTPTSYIVGNNTQNNSTPTTIPSATPTINCDPATSTLSQSQFIDLCGNVGDLPLGTGSYTISPTPQITLSPTPTIDCSAGSNLSEADFLNLCGIGPILDGAMNVPPTSP